VGYLTISFSIKLFKWIGLSLIEFINIGVGNLVPIWRVMEVGLVEQGRERVGHVNKVGYVKRVIAKKRNKPYNRRVKKHVPKALQELFDSCKQTFKGPGTVPSPQDVHKLCHILGMF